MAHYLVGKGGFLKQTWRFAQAIEAANDGDIIELEAGFSPFYEQNNQHITINKSITIEGNPALDENSGEFLINVIDAVFVENGAVVTLRNLEVGKNISKSNNINVKDGSTLVAENVTLTSYAAEGENYPIVYLSNKSQVILINSILSQGNLHDRNYRIYALDSTLEVSNSTVNAQIKMSNSKLDIHDSLVSYAESCALFAEKGSMVSAERTTFEGGAKTEKNIWPCVKLVDSQLKAIDVVIKQAKYSKALYTVNTKVTLDIGGYDSLYFSRSDVSIGNIGVMESVAIDEGSHIEAQGICILGKENGKVNLFIGGESSLKAEMVCFGRLTKPNVKVERKSKIHVEEMIQAAYNLEEGNFILDEEGLFKEITNALEIEYFGKMTAFERLNQMVGINSAKKAVEEFVAIAEMNKKREKQGFKNSTFSLHSLFLGNPGTGKTTVARLVGDILYDKGIINSQKFVETSRSGLVGQYIGETAVKTKEVLESALGGVLFIDEAYTLWTGADNPKDYGIEAINEILKFMEDHRQDIVLIFTGYTHSMELFLESNEGLRSRIPNIFLFEDYTEEELAQIGLGDLQEQKYMINESAYMDLVHRKYAESNDKSNGRWVRNLNEKLIRKMAVRVSRNPNANLVLITQEDIDAV